MIAMSRVVHNPSHETIRLRKRPERCDYCGEAKPEGYVAAYDAWVCRECYEDHHGDID